jgi:HK97 family phage major capsid protein
MNQNQIRFLRGQHERKSKDLAEKISRRMRRGNFITNYIRAILDIDRSDMADEAYDESRLIQGMTERVPNGIYVSLFSLAKRDLNVSTPADGGKLVTDKHDGGLVELLRPVSVAIGSGATLITGIEAGSLILPRLTGAAAVSWLDEGVSSVASDLSFDQVFIEPRSVAVTVNISRRLILQSSVSEGIEEAIKRDILESLFQEIDRVVINGSGAGAEPLGILNMSDVTVVSAGTNGAAPTWEKLTELEDAVVNEKNGANIAFATNSALRKKLRNTAKGPGLDYIWTENGSILGRSALVSSNIPNNLDKGTSTGVCSAMIAGYWPDCVIGFWGPAAIDLVVNKYKFAKEQVVQITAIADIGVAIRHGSSFAVVKDFLTE